MSSVTLPQVGKQEMLNQERGCGDKTVPHADHVDYLVSGRLYHLLATTATTMVVAVRL